MDNFFPLLVNALVGVYFVWFYPRSVRKNFPTGDLPRVFAILVKVIPIFGMALIFTSVVWMVLTLTKVV